MTNMINTTVANYLHEVLGVRSLPKKEQPVDSFLVLFVSHKILSKDEVQLVHKMAQAMQLNQGQWNLIQDKWMDHLSVLEKSKSLVVLEEALFHFMQNNYPNWDLYLIPEPSQMLISSDLKKQAWQTLKSLMLKLNN